MHIYDKIILSPGALYLLLIKFFLIENNHTPRVLVNMLLKVPRTQLVISSRKPEQEEL